MASLADALAYQAKRSQYMDDMTEQPSDLEKAVQDQFGMQPNMDRGALLPYKSKDKGWVAPEVAYQLAKLLASPSVAMHGGNISPQEAIESGNTLSGFMTPAGLLSKPSPAMARMNVYHGSPHKFDKFDSSKIGTGDGAQAYGHGLYFAESPAVAESYKTALAGRDGSPVGHAAHIVSVYRGDQKKALDHLRSILPDPGETTFSGESHDLVKGAIKAIESGAYKTADAGSLYKVDLPDEAIARMLDWDKPLGQQHPDVRQALQMAGVSIPDMAAVDKAKTVADAAFDAWIAAQRGASPLEANRLKQVWKDAQVSHDKAKAGISRTGADAYKDLQYQGRDWALESGRTAMTTQSAMQAKASDDLRAFGIPGIRYLDGGSRTGGAGTSNFVVFPGEEHNLKILKRE